jgi:hypothetical protein
MTEPTQEQLLTYIDAAMTFYEKVNGQGQVPTDRQIHELHGSHAVCMWHLSA